MKIRSSLLTLLVTTAWACSSAAPPPPNDRTALPVLTPDKPTASAPLPPPGLRLPRAVHPLRYEATLTIVPGERTFTGDISIELSLAEPTHVVWLNAEDLDIDKASLEAAARNVPVTVVSGNKGLVGFSLESPAPAGQAHLSLHYRGKIYDNDDHGAFSETHAGAAYVFSQFEAMAARRVFPCVDDPGVKVPWQISLRVPEADVALSNTPVLGEAKDGAGMKLVRFAPTRPLPSYLVAFAVGPFDLVDAGAAGMNKIPVRIAVPRGEAEKAEYAKKTTPPVLGMLEEYTGTAYPYDKLDIVAVPSLASFGAMENPGLVTYASSGLLSGAADETLPFRRGLVATMAHELAHQWFGDLVTMDFWQDIWLNESFATWMGSKIVERFSPSWREDTRRVGSAAYAMDEDGLVSARKVRQEIQTEDDVVNAFDGITYSKGAAVLAMFEAFVGREKFQRGVRRYLGEHEHGNATAADFLGALSAESAPEIGPAFSTFLDQPGVPEVRAALSCEAGKPPAVKLSQSRFLPAGSPGGAAQTWQIPVCLHYGGGSEGRLCTLFRGETETVPLPGAKSCPAWISLKEGGVGYYRADLGKDALLALLDKHKKSMSLPERVAVLADAEALVLRGAIAPADVLGILPRLVAEGEPVIERSAVNFAWSVRDTHLPPELRARFAGFVVRTFGKRARALGLAPKPGEDDDTALLRPIIAGLVADRGEDPQTIAEMRALALRWIADEAATTSDMAGPALTIAVRHGGDRALFDNMLAAAKKSTDSRRRSLLFGALSRFRDPALVDASLALLLGPEIDPREAVWMLSQDERMLDRSLSFVEKNWTALTGRLPEEAFGYVPFMYQGFCDDEHRARLASVFEGRVGSLVGAPRALAQSLESIGLCIAQKKAYEPSYRVFLEKY